MIRVALIGTGGMGGTHYNSYKELDNARVVAVADLRTDVAKAVVGEDDVRIYNSMEELLANEEIDAVDICTPTYNHCELCVRALELGYNVISEKPLGLTNESVAEVMAAANNTEKTFMVAQVVRFMPAYKYLRDLILGGKLGKLKKLSMKRVSGMPHSTFNNWFADPKKSGGAGLDMGVHDLDFIQSVVGMPRDTISYYHETENDTDYLFSTLIYPDFAVNVESGWHKCKYGFDGSYEAVFEEGLLIYRGGKLTLNGEDIPLDDAGVPDYDKLDTVKGNKAQGSNPWADELAYFVSCIENGVSDPPYVSRKSVQNSVALARTLIDNAKR